MPEMKNEINKERAREEKERHVWIHRDENKRSLRAQMAHWE